MDASGPVSRAMEDDHRRLDAVLARVEAAGPAPGPLYDEFRSGLLRHMWVEEHLLMPRVRKAVPSVGKILDRLHSDHGALTALLVPVPTPGILATIRAILAPHNRIEEEPGGLYELYGEEPSLDRAPIIPLRACSEGPEALAYCRRALGRVGIEPLF